MRAQEFIVEYKLSARKTPKGVKVVATDDKGKQIGRVEFANYFSGSDEKALEAKYVFVEPRYQRQGIARDMYDLVKSRGYTIVRSGDQTFDGDKFWNKHRGEDVTVWENFADGKVNDNANSEAWSAITDRVGAEMMESQVQEAIQDRSDHSYTTAYHITGLENAAEILAVGLRPSDGKAFMVVDEGDPKKMREELYTVAAWMDAKATDKDEEMTLLKIDIRGIPLAYDAGWNFATATIPADRIEDLGPDELRKYV